MWDSNESDFRPLRPEMKEVDAVIEGTVVPTRYWHALADGRCPVCNTPCAGVLEAGDGDWGARRQPVHLAYCA